MMIPPSAALVLATALASVPTADVAPGTREVFTLRPEQGRRHRVRLESGQFLQATVYQRGLDVEVRLLAPDGSVIEDGFDASEGPSGREPASILAHRTGTYTIEVWAPDDVDADGRYELETAPPRVPTARDRRRLEAERLTAAGGRLIPPRAMTVRRGWPNAERLQQSLRIFHEASSLWAELGEPCWQAESEASLGYDQMYVTGYTPESEESLAHLVRAAELWQTCGDDQKFAETVLFAGRQFVFTSRFGEAAETYEFGLRLSADLHPILHAQFMVQLSNAYGMLGDGERAIRHGEAILPYLRARGFTQGIAVTLTHLATARYRRGELEQASEHAQEALALRRTVGNEQGIAETLVALGDIYVALGEPEVALGYLQEATDHWGRFHTGWEADARTRTAAILLDLGRPEQALVQLERALELSRRADEWGRRYAVRARLQMVRVFMTMGDWRRARESVDAALGLVGSLGDRVALAEAQELSGRLHLQAGDPAAADTALQQSLELRRAFGDRPGEATALGQLASLARADSDLPRARVLLEEARELVAAQRAVLTSPQLRASWITTVREIDEEYVDVLVALDRAHPGEGFDARAFEASESASARSLLDALTEPARRPDEGASELVSRERSARGRLTTALDAQVRARAGGQAQARLDEVAREVRDLSTEHQRALAALYASDARHAAPQALRLAEVQSLVLDADTTLVEFFLGKERGFAWVVGRDRLQSYELPARARIDAAVETARRALSAPPRTAGRASRALRDLADVVLPADRGWLRGRRLVVVADGSLHYVPFAALPDATGRPLVARFEIANAPSASVALQLRRALAERTPAPRAIAAFADPVYDDRDLRFTSGASGRVADATLARATRDFGFQDGRLPRLPFTRREALAITALAPATSTAALDFRANLDTALAPDLASYRYVHFAAHGLLNDVRPELSGLVLSLVDADGRPRQGLLTAPDVSSLRLGAELVVLSSCRSAAGREVRGEGLVGLTRAFMDAGAPRVVASLWPVDDVASSELMTRMYRGMLGPDQASPAAALRKAQLRMLRHPRWKAPYYWAGFQLQGEWR